ncbi:lysophosphatidylcholine acyltransferase 2-like [Sycon ciliatum]|uniref:lysophosphatidylcholine acyltransferase 2-like n=1 Tax=Sycon ciliatum TaxID=27933 RepID=UPI0031F6DA16
MAVVRTFPAPKVKNPFYHHIQWTPSLVIQTIIGAIFLLPLRALLLLSVVPFVTLVGFIASYGYSGEPHHHLKPWQRKLVQIFFPLLARLGLLGLGYNWIHVKGKRVPQSVAPISVLAPHTLWADGPTMICYALGQVLSRAANKHILMQREILMSVESIFVTPGGAGQKLLSSHFEAPGRYIPLSCYPEGTTHCGDGLLAMKPGVFRVGLPVQPIFFNFGPRDPGVSLWTYDGLTTIPTLLMSMCQFHMTATIEYLPVYNPSAEEKADCDLYAKNFQKHMAKLIGRPATDYSAEDGHLTAAGVKHGLPAHAGAIQYPLFRSAFGFNLAFCKEQVKRFAAINSRKDGFITASEMQSYFHWPIEEDCRRLFSYYATNAQRRDRITFPEFLAGLGDLVVPLGTGNALSSTTPPIDQQAFTLLSGGSDTITGESVRAAIPAATRLSESDLERFVQRLVGERSSSASSCQDSFNATLEHDPELRVLLQWLVHGVSSYPSAEATAAH